MRLARRGPASAITPPYGPRRSLAPRAARARTSPPAPAMTASRVPRRSSTRGSLFLRAFAPPHPWPRNAHARRPPPPIIEPSPRATASIATAHPGRARRTARPTFRDPSSWQVVGSAAMPATPERRPCACRSRRDPPYPSPAARRVTAFRSPPPRSRPTRAPSAGNPSLAPSPPEPPSWPRPMASCALGDRASSRARPRVRSATVGRPTGIIRG